MLYMKTKKNSGASVDVLFVNFILQDVTPYTRLSEMNVRTVGNI